MVQARPFEIDGVVVPGHYVIIADDVVLLQADYNIVAMKRDGKLFIDPIVCTEGELGNVLKFLSYGYVSDIQIRCVNLNNGDLIR